MTPQPMPCRRKADAPQPPLVAPSPGRLRAAGHLATLALLLPAPALAQEAPPARALATAMLPQDLSVHGMVAHADWVVRAVLAGLVLASILTWTIALAKTVETPVATRRTRHGLAALGTAHSLAEAGARLQAAPGACAALVRAALEERTLASTGDASLQERVGWRVERIVAGAGRRLARLTGMLSIIAATAPFVGLFGTVWGIMQSFVGIARSQTTSLAVVAPGIAEALLTTAIGLVAAIPAVVIHTLLARANAVHRARLGDAASVTMTLLSRDASQAPERRVEAIARVPVRSPAVG